MKNSMKKLVTILLAACVGCLCFAGIVGCSSDNSASNSSSASASKSDPTKAEGDARYYAGEFPSPRSFLVRARSLPSSTRSS